MSNRNNGDSSAAIGFGVIGMAAVGIMILFLAVAGFATFVMTIVCVVAWNKPLQMGKWSIEPQEARAFVVRGSLGLRSFPLSSCLPICCSAWRSTGDIGTTTPSGAISVGLLAWSWPFNKPVLPHPWRSHPSLFLLHSPAQNRWSNVSLSSRGGTMKRISADAILPSCRSLSVCLDAGIQCAAAPGMG